jgi:hypothetical protein
MNKVRINVGITIVLADNSGKNSAINAVEASMTNISLMASDSFSFSVDLLSCT